MSSQIRIQYEGKCAILTMDAGENRLNNNFISQINNGLDEIERNDNVAVLITTGTGKFYSNGLDLKWLETLSTADRSQFRQFLSRMFARLLTFKLPTIAAVNGHAYAGGGLLALVHDFRVMRKERGWFCMPEIHLKMQLPKSWMEICRLKIGDKNVLRDTLILGKRYTADEAIESNLIDKVFPGDQLLAEAIKLGNKRLAEPRLAPEVLQLMKHHVYESAIGLLLPSKI